MSTIPHSTEKAIPLICKKCGAEVPPGKLLCDCFVIDAEREARNRAIGQFLTGKSFLYLVRGSGTVMQRHVIAMASGGRSFCEMHQFKRRPETTAFSVTSPIWTDEHPAMCDKCLWVIRKAGK